jgi:hypothetical protein
MFRHVSAIPTHVKRFDSLMCAVVDFLRFRFRFRFYMNCLDDKPMSTTALYTRVSSDFHRAPSSIIVPCTSHFSDTERTTVPPLDHPPPHIQTIDTWTFLSLLYLFSALVYSRTTTYYHSVGPSTTTRYT